MSEPVKLSVVIPVYNVAPYLAKCLESICSQSFKDIELLCVDDASTDGSLSILQEFAAKDSRIKVIQAPSNGGLSRTRNLALDHAVGEYLLLVDSDDWLEPEALMTMYGKAQFTGADRLICGFRYGYEDEPDREDTFIPEDVADPAVGWIPCSSETVGKVHHGANGMMIRRSIVQEHGTRFPEGLLCEDIYFHYVTFPFCKRACVVSAPYYGYRKRSGSITHDFASGHSLKSLDYLKVAQLVLKEWKKEGLLEEYRVAFLKMLVMCVRNVRKYAPHSSQKQVTETVCSLLKEDRLYRPEEDDAQLSSRERTLLKTWVSGKSGLGCSYYWKKLIKSVKHALSRR